MTLDEWRGQWRRLTSHFRLPSDADAEVVYRDWMRAVAHYHVDAVEAGVSVLIRDARETFWPAPGALVAAIRARLAGMERTRQQCDTCQGHDWIEAMPCIYDDGRVYEQVARCPDCGVPAPVYAPSRPGARAMTAAEYAAWRAGTLAEPQLTCAPNRAAAEALAALPRRVTSMERYLDASRPSTVAARHTDS